MARASVVAYASVLVCLAAWVIFTSICLELSSMADSDEGANCVTMWFLLYLYIVL